MLDEIHLKHQLSYKGGKLEGAAVNCSLAEANTAQVFMILSLLSKNKDVVAIVPVRNLTGQLLHELCRKMLLMLHNVGFTVVCLFSDNNRVNRSAFTMMGGGILQVSIQHPHNLAERLFFLFDTVHLFKCVRNNWINQKDQEKTFLFPQPEEGCAEPMKASFSLLRRLHSEEKSSTLKLAPGLNLKALFPTNTEKQNVNFMLKDDRNVQALQHYGSIWNVDTQGTCRLILLVWRLWNILNTKHPSKHIRLRNEDCKPIGSMTNAGMVFIQQIVQWLKRWQGMKQKPREGSLSVETMTALQHTLVGLQDITRYLLEEKGFSYVLLGKFQTDHLEFRFSQYRQLCGSNYHVSVQQILEGEKKLKLVSVLKLVSASQGTLSIKSFTAPLTEAAADQNMAADHTQQFEGLSGDAVESVQVTDEQQKALVFVAGYAASKVVKKIQCPECQGQLCLNKQLQVEVTNDCYTYLSALDRGGLTWPSDQAVDILTTVYKMFQLLIGSKETEEKFLQCGNQRKVLTDLAVRKLAELQLNNKCESCGTVVFELVRQCVKPAVNILLNNYSKNFSDKATSCNNSRKLQTFSS